MHIIIGLIAIGVATGGGGGQEADQSGALQQLSQAPGGVFLMWAAAIGLAALGLWHLLSAFLDRSASSGGERAMHIVKNIAKSLIYLAFAFTAFIFAIGGTTSSSESTKSFSANLMSSPGGVFVVVVIGLVLIGVAIYMFYKGIARKFEEDIRMPSGTAGLAVRILGVVGYVARGIALATVGVLFLIGAATHDAEKANGLDGALKALVSLPFGVALLIAVGLGWIAYGIYMFFRARLAKL